MAFFDKTKNQQKGRPAFRLVPWAAADCGIELPAVEECDARKDSFLFCSGEPKNTIEIRRFIPFVPFPDPFNLP